MRTQPKQSQNPTNWPEPSKNKLSEGHGYYAIWKTEAWTSFLQTLALTRGEGMGPAYF